MFDKIKNFASNHKGIVSAVTGSTLAVVSSVPCFAAEGATNGFIQTSWVSDLLPNITADIGTLMPIGIGIMSLFIGVRLIPRIVYSFM